MKNVSVMKWVKIVLTFSCDCSGPRRKKRGRNHEKVKEIKEVKRKNAKQNQRRCPQASNLM